MRSLLIATTLCLATLAAASSVQVGKQKAASGTPRHIRLGKATEHINKGLYLNAKYGNGSNVPVGGDIWPVSIYWTEVSVGTPAEQHAVVVDSGSSFLYVPGKGCQGCTHAPHNPRYDPSKSSTSSPYYIPFSSSYETCNPAHPLQTCTLSGWLYNDVVSLAGYGPANATVGKLTSITTNTYQSRVIGGIMGMVGPTSKNVFNQLCVAGSFCAPVWSICMYEGTKSNGTLTIGGVDESLADGPISYVARDSNSQFSYRMTVQTLQFGSTSINIQSLGGGSAILDTGTNDLLLPQNVFQETQTKMCTKEANLSHCDTFFSASGNGGTACFNMTDAQVDAYPDLNFALNSKLTLTMTPRDYLLKGSPVATSSSEYCFGIGNGGSLFILGDSIMQHYYLVFAPNSIGWGKVNKKTCGSK